MKTKDIARLGLLLALIIVGQQIKIQHVTGSTVNMVLLLATAIVGLPGAILLSFVSPVLAFIQGNMGFVVMVPVIGFGNTVLCVAYYLSLKNELLLIKGSALVVGIMLKAAILYVFAIYMVGIPGPVALTMMGVNQVVTATIGTVLGLILHKYLGETESQTMTVK